MSSTQTPARLAAPTTEAVTAAQQNLAELTHGYERFVKGLMDVAIQQIELSRSWMEGGAEDFALLAQARTPDALVQAEIEILHRRSERALGTARKIGDEMRQTWVRTTEFGQSLAGIGVCTMRLPAQWPTKPVD